MGHESEGSSVMSLAVVLFAALLWSEGVCLLSLLAAQLFAGLLLLTS